MRYLVSVFAACAILAGCGGSDKSPPVAAAPAPAPAPAPAVDPRLFDLANASQLLALDPAGVGGDAAGDGGVGGAAGDGSPLAGATVFLTDSKGQTVSGKTDANGGYLLRFKTAQFTAPYVLKVVDAGGSVLSSTTEVTVIPGKATRANINPLTDKILSDVLTASAGGTDKAITGAAVNTAALDVAKAALATSIRAALNSASVSGTVNFDAVRDSYKYDGTGVDAVIESINHARDPVTGQTQLQAKLAPLVTNADGTVTPTLITAATPLAVEQVALPTSPALTFAKLNAWIQRFNNCLANGPTPGGNSGCSFSSFDALLGPGNTYLQNGRDFLEDFRTLCSETGNLCVGGSEFRNPVVLFIGRSTGATVDDTAVVEVTIRQPRTGPLAGNLTTPIEYTKVLVFRRNDTLAGLTAGNWYLNGNQRKFDWSVTPSYQTFQQQFSGSTFTSRVHGDIRFTFNVNVFNTTTRSYVPANIYAARVKGPGLPAAGVVLAPSGVQVNLGVLAIHNKTGAIPAPGTLVPRVQRNFRLAAANLTDGSLITDSSFVTTSPIYADSPTGTDFSKLQAYSLYTAEIYVTGQEQPIVETTRTLAALQSPTLVAKRPLHDMTPSVASVLPPQPASNSVTVSWVRRPDAVRIESAYIYAQTAGVQNANVTVAPPDASAVTPTSTSQVVSAPAGTTFPAFAGNQGDVRELGLFGRAGRIEYTQSVIWSR